MRAMKAAALAFLLVVLGSGCSFTPGQARSTDKALQAEVLEYLDAGRAKGALAVADQLVAQAPDDYQSYLTRNAVHVVLRDHESARADNETALAVFEANRERYPEGERAYRLAKIRESMALTALVASRRTQDPAERARQEADFREQAAKVRELDQETWKNLRGLAGENLPE